MDVLQFLFRGVQRLFGGTSTMKPCPSPFPSDVFPEDSLRINPSSFFSRFNIEPSRELFVTLVCELFAREVFPCDCIAKMLNDCFRNFEWIGTKLRCFAVNPNLQSFA